jgi:hypothetical protein
MKELRISFMVSVEKTGKLLGRFCAEPRRNSQTWIFMTSSNLMAAIALRSSFSIPASVFPARSRGSSS